jgi:hypothetical protein
MCVAADRLKQYDTPQALPMLAALDGRAPGRLALALGLLFKSLLQALLFLLVLAVVAFGWFVTYLAYERLLGPIFRVQPIWLYAWLAVAALTALWLIAFNPKVRRILIVDDRVPDVKLSFIWRGLLWLARLVTRIAMIITWLMGIIGLLLPAFYGIYFGLRWLANYGPIVLGPFPALTRYLGEAPVIRLNPVVIASVIVVVVALVSKRLRTIFLIAFCGLGAWFIYQQGRLDPVETAFVLALALLWPLQLTHGLCRILAWSYRRWRDRIEAMVLGWALRDSLASAFAYHRDRNRKRVNKDGRTTVCRNDLAFFVPEQAGPVAFWWCPECHDDNDVYWGVKTVRGILDTAMKSRYEQQDSVLRINLRAWQEAQSPLASPPLDEVIVGKLGDSHEVEMFITQYHSVQAQWKWPSLGKVKCTVLPDTNLDEHSRRQVQNNLRAA